MSAESSNYLEGAVVTVQGMAGRLSERLQPTMSGSFMKIFGAKPKFGLTLSCRRGHVPV